MSLNKKKMVREIGRRTRIRNRDVQAVIEALIDVWTEELVGGGRIELENFLVMEVQTIERGNMGGKFSCGEAPRIIWRASLRLSKKLNKLLR